MTATEIIEARLVLLRKQEAREQTRFDAHPSSIRDRYHLQATKRAIQELEIVVSDIWAAGLS